MPSILIIYYSETGNTKKMAELIGDGVKKENVDLKIESTDNVTADDLLKFDGVIIGSPTYYGTMAAPIKKLLDESVKYHGELDGRVG